MEQLRDRKNAVGASAVGLAAREGEDERNTRECGPKKSRSAASY